MQIKWIDHFLVWDKYPIDADNINCCRMRRMCIPLANTNLPRKNNTILITSELPPPFHFQNFKDNKYIFNLGKNKFIIWWGC
jgi:hypothetical protein